MGDDRPAIYQEGDQVIYRASSIGHCIKMLAATRMGYESAPPPAAMLKVYEEGNKAEDLVVKLLRKRDWQISNRQTEYNLPLTPRLIVRCHIDGMIASGAPIEIKSQSDAEFKEPSEEIWQPYSWQFSSIMLAMNRPKLVVVRFNRDEPDDPKSIAIEFIEEPIYSKAEILKRVLEVERMAHSGVLPEECVRLEYPCPMYRLHPAVVDEAEACNDPVIDEYAKGYDQARTMENQWKKTKEECRKSLRLGLVQNDVRTISGYRVRFRDQPRSTISEKLMRDRGWDPELVKETSYTEYIDVDAPDG